MPAAQKRLEDRHHSGTKARASKFRLCNLTNSSNTRPCRGPSEVLVLFKTTSWKRFWYFPLQNIRLVIPNDFAYFSITFFPALFAFSSASCSVKRGHNPWAKIGAGRVLASNSSVFFLHKLFGKRVTRERKAAPKAGPLYGTIFRSAGPVTDCILH